MCEHNILNKDNKFVLKLIYVSNLDLFGNGGDKIHFIELGKAFYKRGVKLLTIAIKYSDSALKKDLINYISDLNIKFIYTIKKSIIGYFLAEIIKFFYILYYIVIYKPCVIYARQDLFDIIPPVLGRLFNIPYIIEINGIAEDELKTQNINNILILKSLNFALRINLLFSNKIICVTEGLKNYLIIRYKLNPNKIIVINNGVNLELFNKLDKKYCRKLLGINEKDFLIGFVGTLIKWQGIELLVLAIKELKEEYPDLKVMLVGDGPEKAKIMSLIEENNLNDRVILAGKKDYKLIPIYINSFDVCIAPFIKERNEKIGLSPLKIYEYIACSKPIIASDIPGVKEIIEKSNCGFIFRANCLDGLKRAIRSSISFKEHLEMIGLRGYLSYKNSIDWNIKAENIINIIKEIN